MNTTKTISDAIKDATKVKTKAYDTTATVKRIEGSTVWVHIPGGVDETPVKRTINAKVGDAVQVRVSDGSAWLVGNASAPPTDDTRANSAMVLATDANALAESASNAATEAWGFAEGARSAATTAETHADEAKASAENASEYAARALGNLSTVQNVTETLNWITAHGTMTLTTDVALDPTHVYFVVDAQGDYVVGNTHYSVVTEPDVCDIGTYYELSIDESLNNYVGTHLAVTSEGLWLIPDAGGNKVLIATGSGTQYTTAGTYIIGKVNGQDKVLAQFLADGVIIGQSGKTRAEIDFHSFKLIDFEGTEYMHISDLRDSSGEATITQQYSDVPYSTLKLYEYDLGCEAVDTNYEVTFNGGGLLEGWHVIKNIESFAITIDQDGEIPPTDPNNRIIATFKTADETTKAYTLGTRNSDFKVGRCSFAEGIGVASEGYCSHAEGDEAYAFGNASHAEGRRTIAKDDYAHAEGVETKAFGRSSHAEGSLSKATGFGAHAEGLSTVAVDSAHAEGLGCEANGLQSHAEGRYTVADGDGSHSQNRGTIARRVAQTALGTYNDEDASATATHPSGSILYGQYALIIGNGTSNSARSNALTVDWSGDVCLALDTTAASGTTDGDLYAAITALGWENDVIV